MKQFIRTTHRPFVQKHTEKAHANLNRLRKQFGLAKHVTKKRECLRCDREFKSTHFGHRLCEHCVGFSKQASGFDV